MVLGKVLQSQEQNRSKILERPLLCQNYTEIFGLVSISKFPKNFNINV